MAASPTTLSSTPPTRVRYRVIWFAVILSVITYVHRVAISQAAPSIIDDLGLTKVEMGWAFSIFIIFYAMFQVPGGWASDWVGPRRVLAAIVLWWSLFTAATGWIWNLATLLIARAGFGLGQGGAFPVMTKTFTTWLPAGERVRAQGFMWLAARWGGAFTPLLVVALMDLVSWRRAFEIIGVLGLIWAFFFWRWYRDNPRDHPDPNDAELELLKTAHGAGSGHGDVPWRRFFGARTVWLLWLQYACMAYGWYFYITWLPTYLEEGRGVSLASGAVLAGIPLFFGGIGCIFSGFFLSTLERWLGDVGRARRSLAALGCFGAGSGLIVSVHLADPVWAMVAMGIASFSQDLAMPPAWGACMDVGGRYAGSMSGSMNMAGNAGGVLGPPMVAYILQWTNQDWAITFYVSAAVYFVGTVAWLFIDPVTPLDEPAEKTAPAQAAA